MTTRVLILVAVALTSLGPPSRAASPFAAEELGRYLAQMSGQEPALERFRFVIDPALAGGSEAYSIAADAGGVVTITGTNDLMQLSAAYHLLDLLGCRFLAPRFAHYDGSAEIIPRRGADPALLKLDAPIFRKPQLKFRKLYIEQGESHDAANLKQLVEWMPKAGYNTLVCPTDYGGSGRVRWDHWREELTPELQKRGITIEVGGHGYENFINAQMDRGERFARHPDWFGMDERGARSRSKKRIFCTSNPHAVDFAIGNVLGYLRDHREIQIFDFWPPDGALWCACDPCAKLGEPPDRQAILLRQVRERLQAVRPDVRLEAIAYSSYLQPPATQRVDDNVLIDFCPISQHFDAPIFQPGNKNQVYADALLAWRKHFPGDIGIYSYYRKYAWDSLPVIIPRYMQADLRWYAKVPVQGVSTYAEPGDWFTYELNHYVLGQLAWDPDANVDALIEKFCRARYGSASDVARAALDALERHVRRFGSVPHVPLRGAAAIARARDEMQAVVRSLAPAAGRVDVGHVIHALKRLELICTYALRDLEIQHSRAAGAPLEQIVAKIEALHAYLDAHADQGVFVMRSGRLSVKRMLTRYGVAPRAPGGAPE